MPHARKSCSSPGCPEVVSYGRCAGCKSQAERRRGSGAERGWTAEWQRFRDWYLPRYPVCQCPDLDHCPTGCVKPSVEVNHLGDASRVTPDAYEPDKVEALCHGCHSHYTALHQPGGWHQGRARYRSGSVRNGRLR